MGEEKSGTEARKEEIRKRLNLATYSNPHNIIYSDQNDHNPLVLESCPSCAGRGKNCSENERKYSLTICTACDGTGKTGQVVRRYQADSTPIEVLVNECGWAKCPGCGVSFKPTSSGSWTGRRHKTCGQKILLRTEEL